MITADSTPSAFRALSIISLPKLSMALPVILGALTVPSFGQGPAFPLPGQAGPNSSPHIAVNTNQDRDRSNLSCFLNEDESASYIQKQMSVLSVLTRKEDPFGQIQDPNSQPTVIKPTITARRPVNYKPTSFEDIVSRITINTISPANKTFLTGTREFKLGDRFPIQFRGNNIVVEVITVDRRQVGFKKVSTGETAVVKLNLLPAGMTIGADGVTAPGMVTDNPDAPLRIDSDRNF